MTETNTAPTSPSSPAATPSTPAVAQPSASTPSPQTPSSAAQPTAPSRPEYIPESYWDPTKAEAKPEYTTYIRDLETDKSTRDSARLTLPKTPDEYKLENSQNFQRPQGFEDVKLNPDDPLVKPARALMHDIAQGTISGQDAFSKLVDIYVGSQIAQRQDYVKFANAEREKLGATATPRVTAIETFLKAQVGEQLTKSLMTTMVLADNYVAMEKLMASFRGQSTSFTHGNREQPPAPPRTLAERMYPNLVSTTARTN